MPSTPGFNGKNVNINDQLILETYSSNGKKEGQDCSPSNKNIKEFVDIGCQTTTVELEM